MTHYGGEGAAMYPVKPVVSLQEILAKYPTDKLLNGFGPIYEELFAPYRESATAILEIGIFQGGSLQAWEEYFPNAVIVGLDKEREFASKIYGDRIFAMWIDASKSDQLTKAIRRYDIVIDDGSHKPDDINPAFNILWPLVNLGGLYIIEDMSWGFTPDAILNGQASVHKMELYQNLTVIHKCA